MLNSFDNNSFVNKMIASWWGRSYFLILSFGCL